MAADPARGTFLTRLGALVAAPRTLARRDLDARDGRAGDDLIATAALALALDGANALRRGVLELAAGRVNTALHRLGEVLQPALPLIALWLVSTLLLLAFTFRTGRRPVGELGARVAQGFIVTSLVVAPLANLAGDGALGYTVRSLPLAAAALLFGLMLREAVEPPAQPPSLPARARPAGATALVLVALMGLVHLHQRADAALAHQEARLTRSGEPAPAVDLPLVGGGELHTDKLRGRPVVLAFWATWCGPCRAELPVLDRLARAGGPDAPLVYAINIDDPGPERERLVRSTMDQLRLSLPVALDDGHAAGAYAISTIPSLARIDEGGRLVQFVDRPLGESGLERLLR